jgi:hypothetical protein
VRCERPGHRLRWISALLKPLRDSLDERTLRRLTGALTLLLGVGPLVALTDIAYMDREQALDVLAWTAETVVRAAAAAPVPAPRNSGRQGGPAT